MDSLSICFLAEPHGLVGVVTGSGVPDKEPEVSVQESRQGGLVEMTRITIAVLGLAAALSLVGTSFHLTAQRCWYCGVANVGGSMRIGCMTSLVPKKDSRVGCEEDLEGTYCSVKDFKKCKPVISTMTISPDGTVLGGDKLTRGALSPTQRVSSIGGSSGPPEASPQAEEETAVAAEDWFARGRWRVLGCGDIVIERRYSEDIVAGLRESSSLISL